MEVLYLIIAVIFQVIACRTMPDANNFWLGTCIIFGCGICAYRKSKDYKNG